MPPVGCDTQRESNTVGSSVLCPWVSGKAGGGKCLVDKTPQQIFNRIMFRGFKRVFTVVYRYATEYHTVHTHTHPKIKTKK